VWGEGGAIEIQDWKMMGFQEFYDVHGSAVAGISSSSAFHMECAAVAVKAIFHYAILRPGRRPASSY